MAISTLAPEDFAVAEEFAVREEFSQPEPELEELSEKEQEVFEDVIESFSGITNTAEAGCKCGSYLVSELVRQHHLDDKETMKRRADFATMWYKKNFPGENPEAFRYGFLAETATVITLQEMNFDVYQPTLEDDMKGKIDMWAIDSGTQEAYPIQLKSNNQIDRPIVLPVDENLEERHIDYALAQNKHEAMGIFETGAKMLQYMTDEQADIEGDFPGYKIKPLILFVPGGAHNENTVYNTQIGAPGKGYNEKLVDAFFQEVWTE